MAHPQIAAFARLADGNAKPTRQIAGQHTLIARTIHAMAYDPIRDEIVVPHYYAQAILTFRGGANGDEAPVRVLHGPDVRISNAHVFALDPVHRETFVPGIGEIAVYPSDVNGNAAPLRVLKGPDTQLNADVTIPPSVAVDPVHDLLIVNGGGRSGGVSKAQLLIFNRTDSGNAKPRAIISGPKTQLSPSVRPAVYPPRELILAVVPTATRHSAMDFIGVWSQHDRGDVPPRWTIGGPNGLLRNVWGLTLDPEHKSVIISDKYLNAVLTYSFPEIF